MRKGRRGSERAAPVVVEPDPLRLAAARELAQRAPQPAVVGNVHTGTAGWTDRTLVSGGLFYPQGVRRAAERLAHYARHFVMVEVDATYYSLLAPETAARWVQTTPPEFRFNIKAHPALTGHPIEVDRLPADLKRQVQQAGFEHRAYAERLPAELATEMESRFRALLEPLQQAGKLGCVMVQFPPWFGATRGNARRIEALADRFGGTPLSVEFRHASWLLEERRERVAQLLARCGVTYVCVDEPDIAGAGVPPALLVTNPELAVVRLHGRNLAGWQKRGASVHERFNYLYSADELGAWVQPVRELSARARSVHAVFNNCFRDYAVVNAKGLAVLLAHAEAS